MSCCEIMSAGPEAALMGKEAGARIDEERIRLASHPVGEGLVQTEYVLPDMHCAACLITVEKGLGKLPQVERARANLSTRRVSVTWRPDLGKGSDIEAALSALGYEHVLHDADDSTDDPLERKGRELLLALAVAGFAAANIMLLSVSVWSGADHETATLFHLISGLIAVPAVAIAGRPFFSSALRALSARRLNMDVPISLGVLLALGLSIHETLAGGHEAYFDASVMLLFFLLIGRVLDHAMRTRARGAVDRLARLSARGAIAVDSDGSTRYIPIAEVVVGQRLRIRPGERLPVDAEIVKGLTDVDRSLVTGESQQMQACPGVLLEAGVMNLTGAIDVVARSTADSSFLAEIRKMMEAAEHGRSQYVRIAERLSAIYSPAVHVLALVTFIGWMLATGGDWHQSIYTSIAVLIITCPCALGLAVPVVHVIGAGRLFREGIMMRDGSALERLAEVDSVIFDKTGTLTLGEPCIVSASAGYEAHAPLIRALAQGSSHPLSRALEDLLGKGDAADILDLRERPGFGVEAIHRDGVARLGRPSWVAEISRSDVSGASVAFAMADGPAFGFHAHDRLRPDAIPAVACLREAGLSISMMSGDRREAVRSVAAELGIGNATFEATPQQKIEAVNALQAQGYRVLMVGDGLNDAPALAAGHASMAPASASDVGRLASDFVFTRGGLMAVPFAREIALRAGQLVRQNFALAVGYNIIAVPIAILGHATPLIAALAMSASSIIVVANSLRLYMAHERARPAQAAVSLSHAARSLS